MIGKTLITVIKKQFSCICLEKVIDKTIKALPMEGMLNLATINNSGTTHVCKLFTSLYCSLQQEGLFDPHGRGRESSTDVVGRGGVGGG